MKKCFKCLQIKPLSEFYKHSQMADGTVNKCKECNKLDVKSNYSKNREKYSLYEQERNKTEDRKGQKLIYQQNRRKRNPEKYKAWTSLNNAIRDLKIIRPNKCSACNRKYKVQAHHDDYNKPLDVKWLCFKCHRELEHNQIVTVLI